MNSEIEKMIERQFDNFLQRQGPAVVFGIDELLRFIAEEPAVAALADAVRERNAAILQEAQDAGDVLRGKLTNAWNDGLRSKVADDLKNASAGELEELADFERRLRPDTRGRTTEEARMLLEELRHLFELASAWNERSAPEPHDATESRAKEFSSGIKELLRWDRTLTARYGAGSSTALERLERERKEVLGGTCDLDLLAFGEDVARVHKACNEVRAAAADLRTGLLLELGRVRTRVAIVNRYKQRAEWFDRDRLRKLANTKGKPEALLTLDFAKYLFDAGLTPLLDATHGHVRPDVLSFTDGPLFYVEAKQYASAPGTMLKKAYGQVWSTWSKLRTTYRCDEAFLLVFRRGGPHVELPDVVRQDGRRLYSRVVDLTENVGSRAGTDSLHFSEARVLGMLVSDGTADV